VPQAAVLPIVRVICYVHENGSDERKNIILLTLRSYIQANNQICILLSNMPTLAFAGSSLVLYLWLSPKVSFEGNVMGDSMTRFYTVEHLVGMLIGIALVTVGYSRAKRQAELNKGWKSIGTFYLIGLLVILASIPWPFRNLGAGWF